MTPAELELARDAIRAVRQCATGRGILGPAALRLADAADALLRDRGFVESADARAHRLATPAAREIVRRAGLTFGSDPAYRLSSDDMHAIDAAQHLAYHGRAKLRDDGFWVCVTLGNYANKDEGV